MKQVLAAALLAAALCTASAAQDDWPTRPIRLVVPFPPGSSPDLIARMLNDKLGAALGQPVIVDNKPGAGGMVGTGQVAKAQPDGYTLGLSIPGPLAVNTALVQKMEYDPFQELAPVTIVAASPNVLVVDPKLGVNTVQDFIGLVKSRPGELNYGSVGNGSASHLTMELFKQRTGIDIVHVPYPGSPQVSTAILSGQIAGGFVVPATAMPLVQTGRLRALGATTAARSVVLPEIPTIAEQGLSGFESTAWLGIVAPARTPQPIVDRLSRELIAIIRSDDVRQRMIAIYFQPVGTAPEALRILMRDEAERWGKVIKAAGVKPGSSRTYLSIPHEPRCGQNGMDARRPDAAKPGGLARRATTQTARRSAEQGPACGDATAEACKGSRIGAARIARSRVAPTPLGRRHCSAVRERLWSATLRDRAISAQGVVAFVLVYIKYTASLYVP